MGNRRGVTPLQDFLRANASIQNKYLTAALGEFVATFVLMLFVVGAGCQATVMAGTYGEFGSWLMGMLGGSIGLLVAITVFGGLSGAHVNPAFTIATAISGATSWAKVPVYVCAQFTGAYFGSGVAYTLYMDSLIPSHCEGHLDWLGCAPLAGAFAPMPKALMGIAFADQVIGTALLCLAGLAVIDPRNMKVPKFMYGPFFAIAVVGISCTFGVNAGGVLNPARDISARLMAITVGFDASDVFLYTPGTSTEEHYWVAPLFGPFVGGIVAALVYNFVVAAHLREDVAPERQHVAAHLHENVAPEREHVAADPYVPNRFSPQRFHSQQDIQSQSQYSMAPPSQRSYAPQHSQTLPYRNGQGGYV